MRCRIKRLFLAVGAVAAVAIAVPLAGAAQASAQTYYVMLKAEHSQMFVTVPNWTTAPEPAFQWYNADWPESQFILEGQGGSPGGGWSGYFRLRDRWNNLCLDLENNKTAAGTRVVQMPCDGTASQDWSYNSQADAGSQFYRHIMNRYSKLVMDVPAFSTSPSTPIQIWPRNGGTNQRFNILGGVDARVAASADAPRASESTLRR
jgi:Ricin-type beta-trefoil lectin domain-like